LAPARVGCIAWGSLLWDPRSLPLAAPFRREGPTLPIEFSRVALDGRVTLVIDPGAEPIRTWWAPLAVDTVADGIAELARREGVAAERVADWIGVERRAIARAAGVADGVGVGRDAANAGGAGIATAATRAAIAQWLASRSLDAILWTALPVRRPDGRFERPDGPELVAHLERLEGAARARAEQYIRRAPTPLRTPNRRLFEATFGWTSAVERVADGATGGE